MKHVIIGNGPAGVVAAETLRKADPSSDILMFGAEPEPAYSRMAIPYMLIGRIGEQGTYLRKDIPFPALIAAIRSGPTASLSP